MQKNKKIKPKKTAHHKKKISKFLIVLSIIVLLLLCFGTYCGVRLIVSSLVEEANPTANPSPTPATQNILDYPSEYDLSDSFSIIFNSPKLIGAKRAIISAGLSGEKSGFATYGFLVRNTKNNTGFEISANSSGGLIYANIDALSADSDYLVVAYRNIEGEKVFSRNTLEFATPAYILTDRQVDDILEQTFPEDPNSLSEEKQMGYQTDACLSIMGFDVGEFGVYDAETKAAILMLEYSFNSVADICNWHAITGLFTESLLNTLKDILSVTPMVKKGTVLKPFAVSDYALTPYANYTESGAAINCEQLVLDAIKQNEAASATFVAYPFVVDSAEFQEKYAQLINDELDENSSEMGALASIYGWDTFRQPSETMLAAIAAKNKVYFSDKQTDLLFDLSSTLEAPYILSGSESNQTAFTLLTPAAVAFCYMNADYTSKFGNAMPVTLSLRNTPKNWTAYSNGFGKNEVIKFSALWHLTQQETEAVPGFCLSEYLVSVDFAPADDTILSTDVYSYLYTQAARFGFYPDTVHPYRWLYLGKTVPDETLTLAPPLMPLEN